MSKERSLPGFTIFCICKGVASELIRAEYPDLKRLYSNVDVGNQDHFDILIEELEAYLSPTASRVDPIKASLLHSFANSIYKLRYILYFPLVALIFMLAPFSGMVASMRNDPSIGPRSHLIFGALAFFNLGLWLTRVPALDLWPWLGRRWQTSREHCSPHRTHVFSVNAAAMWVKKGCLDGIPSDITWNESTGEEYSRAKLAWLQTLYMFIAKRTALLLFLGSPALYFFDSYDFSYISISAFAFLAGIVLPSVFRWRSKVQTRIENWRIGLEDREFERGRLIFSPGGYNVPNLDGSITPSYTGKDFSVSEKSWMVHWLSEILLRSTSAEREWLPKNDHIFISYPWASSSATLTAKNLYETVLNDIGKKVFLDKQDVCPFSAWRIQVVEAITNCTHVFVVIGGSSDRGETWHRELKMVLHRWNTELEPSVICVVDKDVLSNILSDANTPLELRFLLQWCPVISHAEAGDVQTVAAIIKQRKRQGKLSDYLTLMCPFLGISRFKQNIVRKS